MKEKYNLVVFILCLAVFRLQGINLKADQDRPKIDFVETKVVDGFFIGVTDEFGRTNTSPDTKLCFSIWTTNKIWTINKIGPTNYTRAIFPTEPEIAYQIGLFDANGAAIPKTERGKKVGTKFFDFNANSFILRSTGPDGYSGPGGQFGVKAQVTGVTKKAWEPQGQMLLIFRPSDLFKIDKPGKYTLRIRFQILAFPRTGPGPGDYTTDLIRFPPLDYPLDKPDSSPKKP